MTRIGREASWPSRRSGLARARRHASRLVVFGLFAAAAFLAYELVAAERARDAGSAPRDRVAAAAAPAAAPPAASASASSAAPPATPDLDADEVAESARESVFRLESPAGLLGSAFVAWVAGGRTYLLTAHSAVQAVVTDGYGELRLRRGHRIWRAAVVRDDKLTGLVLLRVERRITRPLWTEPELLEPVGGEAAVIAPPPGRDVRAAAGSVEVVDGLTRLETVWRPLHLGAPVVAADGTVVGVVVATDPTGAARVTSLRDACGKIRRC